MASVSNTVQWRTVTLGDCAVINDATYSPKEAWPFIHYLDTGNVTDNRVGTIRRLVPGTDKIPSRARRKVQPGDIVYSTVRPDQRHFGLLKDPPDNLLVSTAFAVIRGKAGVAHTDFLYWFLAQGHVVERLHTIAEHSVSAYPSIRPDDIARLELRLPPLPEQHRIAHVLGTLDDKIALNRRLNATLEDMARALFKSWFVDFDPVHAKAALKRRASSHHSPLQAGDETATAHGRLSSPPVSPSHHSPLEGESARQGRSPQSSRWGVVRRGYSRRALTAARALRRNRTDAEGLLWHYLRNKQLGSYRFRRQQPIGPYIVDFACLSRKVLIELDGGQHAEQTSRDEKRDAFLRARGYRVLRFWNTEVFENCFGVLERVYEAVAGDPPPQSPAPEGLATATPPQGGNDRKGTTAWTVERARAYLDGMDPEVVALFPDGFEKSAVGPIPRRWALKKLKEFGTIVTGKTPDTHNPAFYGADVPFLKIPDMHKRIYVMHTHTMLSYAGASSQPTKALPPGSMSMSCIATPGLVVINHRETHTNQQINSIVPNDRRMIKYLYWACRGLSAEVLAGGSGGSVFGNMNKSTFSNLSILNPGSNLIRWFEKMSHPIHKTILLHEKEICTLTSVRDTLLLRLISDELEYPVSNLERDVHEPSGDKS